MTPIRHFCATLLFCLPLVAILSGCDDIPLTDPTSGATRIPLENAENVRDLGGYHTTDGLVVRKGLLYRSGDISRLSEHDLQWMEQTGLSTVYDFRSQQEIAQGQDRLPASGRVQWVHLPIADDRLDIARLRDQIMQGDLSGLPEDMTYTHVVLHYTGPLRDWFQQIATPGAAPLLFHCTAGKDRTGVAALLLLMALGVPEDQALKDFMASNTFLEDSIEKTLWKVRIVSLLRADEERLRGILGVEKKNMTAALDAIRQHYGSVDNYLRTALGVDDTLRARLRALYLKPQAPDVQ